MKKLFSLCLLLCLWIPLCAFTSVTTGTIMYKSGAVCEVVSIKYTEDDAEKLGQTFSALDSRFKSLAQVEEFAVKSKLLDHLGTMQNINLQDVAEKISVEVGVIDGSGFGTFSVVITYENQEVWALFQKEVKEATTTTLEETLFIKKYTITSPVRLAVYDNFGQKQNLYQFVLSDIKSRLSAFYGNVDSMFDGEYSYTYASSIARLHTDADTVETSLDTNLVYYTWNFNDSEDAIITLWQLRANATTWYVLALVLTAGFGFGLWIASKKKTKNQTDENA